MLRKLVLILVLMQSGTWAHSVAHADPLDPTFFANVEFQKSFPGASVLHPDSLEFLKRSMPHTVLSAHTLIASIRSVPGLAQAIVQFPKLSVPKRIQVMKKVFELEVKASGVAAPELVLDTNAKRSAFFEFDPRTVGTGKVILNPAKLFADSNPYAALLFLIHETRHSYQFQISFDHTPGVPQAFAKAYHAGFSAQRLIFDKGINVSFCDFLTLSQEYEAFLFGNSVMEILTGGIVETSDMGTLASQYVPGQGLRLNLPKLAHHVGPHALLDAFNELEKVQYRETKGSP